jgi:hypothetical protein
MVIDVMAGASAGRRTKRVLQLALAHKLGP